MARRRNGHWGYAGATAIILAAALLAVGVADSGGASSRGAQALSVPAGFDLLETDPQQTVFRFQGGTAIPAGFFGPRAHAFNGAVHFGGVPLGRFHGKRTGPADSVVQRFNSVAVPDDGSASAAVTTRLIRLSLRAIAPIRVRVGRRFQRWDVRATVSQARPSSGELRLYRTTASGGTLDSQLTVYPKFTFRRLSDGDKRVLDIGALPDGIRPEVVLLAHATPWRTGCVPPALRIPGLNDRFCASFSPYSTLPARPLDNYRCYRVRARGRYRRHSLRLRGRLAAGRVTIGAPVRLCTPVQAGAVPIEHPIPRLVCYRIVHARPVARLVVVRTRFRNRERVRLKRAGTLCTPSLMVAPRPRAGAAQEYGPPGPGALVSVEAQQQAQHAIMPPVQFPPAVVCDATKPSGTVIPWQIGLADSLYASSTPIGDGTDLCAPAGEPGEHGAKGELRCYGVNGAPLDERVLVQNELGSSALTLVQPQELCAPAVQPIARLGCDPINVSVKTKGESQYKWTPEGNGVRGGLQMLGRLHNDVGIGYGFEVTIPVVGNPSECTFKQVARTTRTYIPKPLPGAMPVTVTWTNPPGGADDRQFHADGPNAPFFKREPAKGEGIGKIVWFDRPFIPNRSWGKVEMEVIVYAEGQEVAGPAAQGEPSEGTGESVFARFRLCAESSDGPHDQSFSLLKSDFPDASLPDEAKKLSTDEPLITQTPGAHMSECPRPGSGGRRARSTASG